MAERLRKARLSGRTVTVKVRLHDFSTLTRSATLPGPTDDARADRPGGPRLLGELDTSGGVRLLGRRASPAWPTGSRTTCSPTTDEAEAADGGRRGRGRAASRRRGWSPGMDVVHEIHGRGWVWGSGRGVVTVRFETAETGPGRVLSFGVSDPELAPFRPPEE